MEDEKKREAVDNAWYTLAQPMIAAGLKRGIQEAVIGILDALSELEPGYHIDLFVVVFRHFQKGKAHLHSSSPEHIDPLKSLDHRVIFRNEQEKKVLTKEIVPIVLLFFKVLNDHRPSLFEAAALFYTTLIGLDTQKRRVMFLIICLFYSTLFPFDDRYTQKITLQIEVEVD